ncbi:nucleoside 2-deoxyribosyltransferase [Verrucosispora sp. NA02020]|uniref:nucleoside 2-deoxyribosyltransferase n=1 Tax=unclassified Micromonospora TaxID=2617518 RepID=UPI001590E4C8|nr:nucleoside 2-deoxyribosyltransferase [Verrucosispora sp. NA02020]QKW12206.1 nucleoside 2-deoxyribosyltransferase [Verrucosispora sp. NA02020]
MSTFEGIRVYAAGKITQNGWRHSLFPIFDDADTTNPDRQPWPEEVRIPALPGAVYVGPHFMSDDHGCYHGENMHGVAAGEHACGGAYPGLSRPEVAQRCLAAIRLSTHVFAWLDDPTCHGSLVEIGYARALGKQVFVYTKAGQKDLADLWFAKQIANAHAEAATAEGALADFRLRVS